MQSESGRSDRVRIRPAGEADSGDIVRMLTRLAAEIGESERFRCRPEDIAEHGFGAAALFRCLIADRDGHHVGLALFFPVFSTIRGRPGVYLQDLWVDAAVRGDGVGERLMRAVAASAAKDWDAAYLELMVHADNRGAIRFYRRHGLDARAGEDHLCIEGLAFDTLHGGE